MNQSQGILVGVIIILLIAGGVYIYYNPPGQAPAMTDTTSGTDTTGGDTMTPGTGTTTTSSGGPQATSATVQLNGVATLLGVDILPLQVTEDSRCAVDVQCIQAGTVQLKATTAKTAEAAPVTFTLGQPMVIGNVIVTLSAVTPDKHSNTVIASSDYRFTFTATSK